MSAHPVNVLLFEDNPEQLDLLRQLFDTSPDLTTFRLATAGRLGEGVQRLNDGAFDLILLDLGLPDSDGIETFIRVLEAAPDVPIVVLSGINHVALAIETVQLGAQDYLVKGRVGPDLLIRSMQYARERKRGQLALSRANDELELRVQERTAALQDINARLEREIAERKRAEEETVESNRQLSAALGQIRATQNQVIVRERMHALGRMANGIAHDFNNTLSPILGFSELLLMKPDSDPAKQRHYLEAIFNGARDAAQVVSRLREFYRHRDEDEDFAPVLVNDLIERVVSFTQPRWKDQALAAGTNIEFKLELGQVPSLPGIESELREALLHLLFNSIEAISGRGRITLRTGVQGRWLVITVTDDGAGMTPEVRERCIEPFFTTKGDQAGGLGLGSVYGIVGRHEGEMDIQSEPGRGTSVTLSLPLEHTKTPPKAPKPPAQSVRPLRILSVDDEPMVREVISVFLGEDQHKVTEARDGREGLDLFRQGQFDVVITDRAMPELNGDQLALEIKKLNPSQPVILLTGFGDLMQEAGEKPEGVDLVVPKPFTLDSLRDAIQTVTRGR